MFNLKAFTALPMNLMLKWILAPHFYTASVTLKVPKLDRWSFTCFEVYSLLLLAEQVCSDES